MYPYNCNSQSNAAALNTRENTNAMYRLSKDKHLLGLLSTAIWDTEELAPLFEELSQNAGLGKDASTLRSAYLDSLKHSKQLKDIYYQITGQRPSKEKNNRAKPTKLPGQLSEALEMLFLDELENTDFYRDLFLLMPPGQLRDTLFELITDKQDHCNRLCYLYSKYK